MKKIIVIVILCLLSGGIGYFIAFKIINSQPVIQTAKEIRLGQTGFVNPLVEYEVSEGIYSSKMMIFDNDVKNLTNSYVNEDKANTISVYFRSLNDGPWFGVNEDTNYFPASLLKLPIAIAYYKESETNPLILKKMITYTEGTAESLGDYNSVEYYKPSKSIEVGKTYSVEELIEYMLEYSDNNAKNLLVMNMKDTQMLYKIYTDLGLATPPELRGNGDVLTTHEYATFYRTLYNVSYLNKDDSNKILEMLSKTDFDKGLTAGIPNNIVVSHKFGEHSDDNYKQLHDCGIVYYPKNPYILCIMTRGSSFDDLESVISSISKSVYEHVDEEIKGNQSLKILQLLYSPTPQS